MKKTCSAFIFVKQKSFGKFTENRSDKKIYGGLQTWD